MEDLEVYREEVADLVEKNVLEEGNPEGADCGTGKSCSTQNRGFWIKIEGLVGDEEDKGGKVKEQNENTLGGLGVGGSCPY